MDTDETPAPLPAITGSGGIVVEAPPVGVLPPDAYEWVEVPEEGA